MKKLISAMRKSFLVVLVTALFALASCANDIDSASTTIGVDTTNDDSAVLNDNDGKSDKTDRKDGNGTGSGSGNSGESGGGGTVKDFSDGFIRGFDASAVDYFENVYASSNTWTDKNWYDADESKDIFTLLADHGFNTIRIRVWVDPTVTSTISNDDVWPTSTDVENAWKNGDNTKERAATLANRAKAAGMNVLLDFHLSDYWTDPAVQLIPKSWQSAATADEMKEKLTSHITEVLQYMKENSVTPDYVQVGNEIDRGILVDESVNAGTTPKSATAAASAISGGYNTENFKTYLKAGCAAVRDFDEGIKIIIHITAKNSARFSYVKASDADYDIIGLSYYSWENHGTMDELISKIDTLKSTYKKDVMVVETSFTALKYGDNFSSHMTQAATNLSGKNYSDVTIENNAVVPSEDVQKAILRHTMQEVYDAGGIGICVWGGERRDYQYGLSDWAGNVYKAIDAFNYKPTDGYTSENISSGGDGTGSGTGNEDGNDSGDNGSGDGDNSGNGEGTGEETSDDTDMTLTLTFDDFTIAGGSVNVHYGAKETSYADVSASVSTDGKSATATLSKTYANSSNWFNGITITVKDSSETAVEVEYTDYFAFNTDGVELKVKAGSAKKTFTINFDGFTIDGGSVTGLKYSTKWFNSFSSWEADTTVTPTVTVSSGGTKATFEVEKIAEFYIDWTSVIVKDSSGAEITISSGNTNSKDEGTWYSYSGTQWSNTLVGNAGTGTGDNDDDTGTGSGDNNNTDTKTFTINFNGFTIVGGSVSEITYATAWNSSNSAPDWSNGVTVTPKVNDSGTAATFDVANTTEFYIDWRAVTIKNSSNDVVAITSGNTNTGSSTDYTWYDYGKDVWSVTFVVDGDAYTQLGETISVSSLTGTLSEVISAAKFAALDLSKVKIVVSDVEGSAWITLSADSAWKYQVENMQTTGTKIWSASDEEGSVAIAALQTYGLKIAGGATSCKVSVYYVGTEVDATKTPGSFTVTPTTGDITSTTIPLTWGGSENATRYVVQYKTGEGEYKNDGVTTGTSYTIESLTASTEYTILVTAYYGSKSSAATEVKATTGDTTGGGNNLLSSETLTIATAGTYQLAVSYDTIKDYSKVYITLANITDWGSGTDYETSFGAKTDDAENATWKVNADWKESGNFTDSNVGGTTGGHEATISPSDYTNGVYITGKSGLAGTLYVTGVTATE